MGKLMQNQWVYDIETYYDLFSACFVHLETRQRYIFEVSDRRDQSRFFVEFIMWLRADGARMIGFNNEGFDWPVVQRLVERAYQTGSFAALDAHRLGTEIITGDRFANSIWPDQRLVPQVDLYKIHHFDNMAKATSLKKLEINMRSVNVIDLPYPPDQPTTRAQKDEIIAYMCHDVSETLRFAVATAPMIAFRDELIQKYPTMGDVVNMNDTKIGKKFFEMELEKAGIACYTRDSGRRQPRQTIRTQIPLRDVISPKVEFRHPDLQRVKTWLEQQTLTQQMIEDSLSETVETKGVFKGVNATVDGFTFHFGTGGIHGSIENTVVRAGDGWEIWDWDVESFYPNLGITGRLYPAHLSEAFCDIYEQVFRMRKSYPKGTAENEMLKLALNGVYGDSNNKYSIFYDPQYTMSITINGQLMLCMLAEWLMTMGTDQIQMIQANTDGITFKIRSAMVPQMHAICDQWMKHTGLKLESAEYEAMFIRDVNSYLAKSVKGKIKRIGAYAYQTWFDDPTTRERQWHQDHSMLVVRKAAEAAMLHGTPVAEFIRGHLDPFDFMLSVKVDRNSRLMWGDNRVQNITRYYVSTDGHGLVKWMPPLKGKSGDRSFEVQKGWTVTPVNDATQFDWRTVNWLFYINEAEKLVVR